LFMDLKFSDPIEMNEPVQNIVEKKFGREYFSMPLRFHEILMYNPNNVKIKDNIL